MSLVIFVVMIMVMAGVWGTQVFSTGFFVLAFAAYVPMYFGVLVLLDWLDDKRRGATRR